MSEPKSDLESGYDLVAEHYATEFFAELARKPFDRQLLDEFAKSVAGQGKVCEFGCGPGQVARSSKIAALKCTALRSRRRRLELQLGLTLTSFSQGNMMATEFAADSFAGVVLFYSI